ncbi:hypothetical protein [Kitasatospora sp. NBC_00458]|uniref:hypothetical protein n=1 Tax=Kitasatospora sp. NBC_00458 TaxID=2903568 RepID=UPI002E17435A
MSSRSRAATATAGALLALSTACASSTTSATAPSAAAVETAAPAPAAPAPTAPASTAPAPTAPASAAPGATTPPAVAAPAAPSSTAPAVTAPPAEAPRPAGDRAPGCRTDDGNQERLERTPPGTEFKPLGSLQVPTSRTAGPLIREGGHWHCFARTPEGAARAAAVFAAIDTGHEDWEVAARAQIHPPSAAKSYADKRLKDPINPEGVGEVKVAAFSVMTYTPEQSHVMLLVRFPGGLPAMYGAVQVDLRWVDGDWRMDVEKQGMPELRPFGNDMANLTPW